MEIDFKPIIVLAFIGIGAIGLTVFAAFCGLVYGLLHLVM